MMDLKAAEVKALKKVIANIEKEIQGTDTDSRPYKVLELLVDHKYYTVRLAELEA